MNKLLTDYEWKTAYNSPQDDLLNDFYIPALERSVRYDRTAGYFRSSALAIAAKGVARLIRNGGKMRLLVGTELDPDDVSAICKGLSLKDVITPKLLKALSRPPDEAMRHRLEILAWMVAHGTLQIRVVIPFEDGQPSANAYFHIKSGIFTDTEGNRMAFVGSINESESGWLRNHEYFHVFTSWAGDSELEHLEDTSKRFDDIWNGRDEGWLTLDIPDAVREALLKYAPEEQPKRDPLEPSERDLERERIVAQFIRDAPRLPNARHLGILTAAVRPWPHQLKVADKIIRTYPRSYLLCDEVGLGKTIEAGLVLRQLLISGWVKRCLLLIPKSVMRQWQEELYEKFNLNIPAYDGKRFRDYFGKDIPFNSDNPWDAQDVFMASAQLAKRRERQKEVLAARPWDLVLVDEAHHARRKRPDWDSERQPNRMLELLDNLRLRSKAMLLLTATPMQIHPVEVWDLLKVLGVGGTLGAYQHYLLVFTLDGFKDNLAIISKFACEYLTYCGEIDEDFEREVEKKLGPVVWSRLERLPCSRNPEDELKALPPKARPYAIEMAQRHTPLKALMFRNTRDLLHEYRRQGLMRENVPVRKPKPVWICMTEQEKELYRRTEEYVSQFYKKYEEQRTGLGFVMTVYRRRLTSSFYAVRRSLERRLAFLRNNVKYPGSEIPFGLTDDDIEQDDLSTDVAEELTKAKAELYADEVECVEELIQELEIPAKHDSKAGRLISDLSSILARRDKVIIFTQYADTMDYLRDKLVPVYGKQVACYSGRGGEVWEDGRWKPRTKEYIKQRFGEGDPIKILVCTEAASEGINLQTCGVLINYDMPWNPMRVEQRIGRVDRIGQVHDEVWIYNYFYDDTIEADVYKALSRRIRWFEDVVGDLQPILADVGRTIQKLAMTPPSERKQMMDMEMSRIEEELDRRGVWGDIYEGTRLDLTDLGPEPPLRLKDLEEFMTSSLYLGRKFRPHPEIKGAYLLRINDGEIAVTFNPDVFDRYPNSTYFLSYGSPIFQRLLDSIPQPENPTEFGVIRFSEDSDVPITAYYTRSSGGGAKSIESLDDLQASLNGHAPDGWTQKASEKFRRSVGETTSRIAQAIEKRINWYREEVKYLAETLLRQAVHTAVAAERHTSYPRPEFSESELKAAFGRLRNKHRHLSELLDLIDEESLIRDLLRSKSSAYEVISDAPRRLNSLNREAGRLLREFRSSVEMMRKLLTR